MRPRLDGTSQFQQVDRQQSTGPPPGQKRTDVPRYQTVPALLQPQTQYQRPPPSIQQVTRQQSVNRQQTPAPSLVQQRSDVPRYQMASSHPQPQYQRPPLPQRPLPPKRPLQPRQTFLPTSQRYQFSPMYTSADPQPRTAYPMENYPSYQSMNMSEMPSYESVLRAPPDPYPPLNDDAYSFWESIPSEIRYLCLGEYVTPT
nr:cyclin-K-like [Lytechinus pictus]